MSSYQFSRFNDLISVLYDAKQLTNEFMLVFDDWEVMHISIDAPMGLQLSLNTKISGTGGNDYMLWKKVKHVVKSFLSQDIPQQYSDISWYETIPFQISDLDIRLRCPKNIKDSFDKKSEFESFRLNFLVNSGLVIVNATTIEKSLPVSSLPVELWDKYIGDILRKWESDRVNN